MPTLSRGPNVAFNVMPHFLDQRLSPQTNTNLFNVLCPHSHAPWENFLGGHSSRDYSKSSTLNYRVSKIELPKRICISSLWLYSLKPTQPCQEPLFVRDLCTSNHFSPFSIRLEVFLTRNRSLFVYCAPAITPRPSGLGHHRPIFPPFSIHLEVFLLGVVLCPCLVHRRSLLTFLALDITDPLVSAWFVPEPHRTRWGWLWYQL